MFCSCASQKNSKMLSFVRNNCTGFGSQYSNLQVSKLLGRPAFVQFVCRNNTETKNALSSSLSALDV